jgi:ribonuclease P protein component
VTAGSVDELGFEPRNEQGVVLPTGHRMRRSQDYATAVRRGRRAARSTLVAHLAAVEDDQPARVGFVVSRAVGGAVTRNLVRRRLRQLARERLARLEAGRLLVVRALPRAATATNRELAADLDGVLQTLFGRDGRAGRGTAPSERTSSVQEVAS